MDLCTGKSGQITFIITTFCSNRLCSPNQRTEAFGYFSKIPWRCNRKTTEERRGFILARNLEKWDEERGTARVPRTAKPGWLAKWVPRAQSGSPGWLGLEDSYGREGIGFKPPKQKWRRVSQMNQFFDALLPATNSVSGTLTPSSWNMILCNQHLIQTYMVPNMYSNRGPQFRFLKIPLISIWKLPSQLKCHFICKK